MSLPFVVSRFTALSVSAEGGLCSLIVALPGYIFIVFFITHMFSPFDMFANIHQHNLNPRGRSDQKYVACCETTVLSTELSMAEMFAWEKSVKIKVIHFDHTHAFNTLTFVI